MEKKSIGYIYEIRHKTRKDTPVYFGSTINLIDREKQHRYNCCDKKYKKHNYYVYEFIRDYGGWYNWKMTKLHEVLFSNKNELKDLEKLYIKNHLNEGKKCLNQTIPNRTSKEWAKDNPDKISNINIRARLRHREKQNEYRRQHYHKNKERILKKNREYYEKNKEKVEAGRRAKWRCLCGEEMNLRSRTDHLKTQRHHKKLSCLFKQ